MKIYEVSGGSRGVGLIWTCFVIGSLNPRKIEDDMDIVSKKCKMEIGN